MIISLSALPVTTLLFGNCIAAQTAAWCPLKVASSTKALFTIDHSLAVQSQEEVKNVFGLFAFAIKHTVTNNHIIL